MCYSLWYKAWKRRNSASRLYTASCNTQSSAPEDGRNYRPKHVELIGISNKPLLLHLVCFLYYLQADVLGRTVRGCQLSSTASRRRQNRIPFRPRDKRVALKPVEGCICFRPRSLLVLRLHQ